MMIPDSFSGDPRKILSPSGSDIDYEGGQPVMDAGLENQVMISLFTRPGWCGNAYLTGAEQIGSGHFLAACDAALTLQSFADIQNGAELDLKSDLLPNVAISIVNPNSWDLQITIQLANGQAVTLDRRSMLWSNQSLNPASARLVKPT
jgi:hypothetical protein